MKTFMRAKKLFHIFIHQVCGCKFPYRKNIKNEEEGEEYGELLTSHSRQSSVDVMKRKIGICLIYTTHYDPITRKCVFMDLKNEEFLVCFPMRVIPFFYHQKLA